MKKMFRSLFILSLSAAALGGCALDEFFGGNTKVADHIDVRDYSADVNQNSKYTFDGKVFAIYEDKSEEEVTKTATFSEVDTSKLGLQDLTVKYEDSKYIHKKTVSLNIVKPEENIPLESISIPSTINVDIGSSYTVNPTFTPNNATNKQVSYAIADTSIATVSSSGSITAKAVGTTTLTVTSKANSSIKATAKLKVNAIALQSISIPSTITVGVGKTKTITPEFTPSNATNKQVTYSIANTSLATVSQSGVITPGSTEGTTTLTVTSKENSSIKATATLTISAAPQDEWTILVYMCGANLESQDGAATEDLQEIASVSGQPDDVNVVVQAGGSKSWNNTYSSVISSSTRNRIHLNNKTYVRDDSSTQAKENMGAESTLKSFVKWGLETYPADKIGLIFWNHGGAMSGCCGDEQFSNDYLMNDEIVRAIRAAKSEAGYSDKFEFIGYDCCLMQVQDIAGTNSEFAKYMIASEASEWGYGWSYEKWIDDVYAGKTTPKILSACIDGFAETTNASYGSYPNDQTLSYINLSYWESYETAWDEMITSINITSQDDWNEFADVVDSSYTFESGSYDNYDVGNFITKMKGSSSPYKNNNAVINKVDALNTIYKNLIGKSWHGNEYSDSEVTGLTLFCPNNQSISKSDYNTTACPFSVYRDKAVAYGWNYTSSSGGGGWWWY